MKHIYLISGLGADYTVFKYLNFGNHTTHFLEWKPPGANESMETYAKRMAADITEENPILVGLSFGGMMAMEIAKIMPVEKIILISSAKAKREIPFYFRKAATFGLQNILPFQFTEKIKGIIHWYLGVETEEEKELADKYLATTNKALIKWSVTKIITWRNTIVHPNLVHIHGTHDRLLPADYITEYIPIEEGGHFMIMNRADEINKHLAAIL